MLAEDEIETIRHERAARVIQDLVINSDAPQIAHVGNLVLPDPDGRPCRLYLPVRNRSLPLLIYLHGGGWMFGSLESHDRLLRQLANFCDVAVLAVDYRLAPEHPFPAARDDVLRVLEGVRDSRIFHRDVDSETIFLAGDSAGAHIALAAGLSVAAGALAGIVLFYGVYGPRFDTSSHLSYGGGGFGLSTAHMRRYWAAYLDRAPHERHMEADLIGQDLTGLPDIYLGAAELDPLLSDSLALEEALAKANVLSRITISKGMHHGYLRHLKTSADAEKHLQPVADFISLRCKNEIRRDHLQATSLSEGPSR